MPTEIIKYLFLHAAFLDYVYSTNNKVKLATVVNN